MFFDDDNRNDLRNSFELASHGLTVFIDANADGLLGPNELRTVTDVNGDYAFIGIPADGAYLVGLVTPSSHLPTVELSRTAWTTSSQARWLDNPEWSVVMGDNTYLAARGQDGSGLELWKFDGLRYTRVADLNPNGDGLPSYGSGVAFGGKLYFAGNNGDGTGWELYRSDGTTIERVGDFNTVGDFFPQHLTVLNDTLYMSGDSNDGREVEWYRLDESSVVRVTDMADSSPRYYYEKTVVANNRIYFVRESSVTFNASLASFDGTSVAGVGAAEYVTDFESYQGKLAYGASSPATGYELYFTDGTTIDGPFDLNVGTSGSYPAEMVESGGLLYFQAYTDAEGTELWSFDGTTPQIVEAAKVPGDLGSDPRNLTSSPLGLFYMTNSSNGAVIQLLNRDSSVGVVGQVQTVHAYPAGTYDYTAATRAGVFTAFTASGGLSVTPKPFALQREVVSPGSQNLNINFDAVQIVDAGQSFVGNEGETMQFAGWLVRPDAISANVSFFWEVRQNNVLVYTSPETVMPASVIGQRAELNYTPTDNARYTATLILRDGDKRYEQAAVLSAVTTPPTFTLPATLSATEGRLFTSIVSFADRGQDAWQAMIDYGDGSVPDVITIAGTRRTFDISHTYPDDGVYPITVTLRDTQDRLETVASSVVTVAPLTTLQRVSEISLVEGGLLSRNVTFTDGRDSWEITVDYGDGSPVETLTSTVLSSSPFVRRLALNHRYADNGFYSVLIRVVDLEDNATVTTSIPIKVTNSAPTLTINTPTGTPTEGLPLGFSAIVSDVGADLGSVTIEWDFSYDGVTFNSEDTGASVSSAFADGGSFVVAARVRDKDGAVSSVVTRTVVIGNADPVVELGSTIQAFEGDVVRLVGSQIASDVAADALTFGWTVRNAAGTIVSRTAGATFSFAVPDNLTYTLTVVVRDDDGATVTDTVQIVGANLAPSALRLSMPATSIEGRSLALNATFVDAGVNDVVTYRWEVVSDSGQIIPVQSGTVVKAGVVPRMTFQPKDDGVYRARLTLNDGLATSVVTGETRVVNAAPSAITIEAVPTTVAGTLFNVTGAFVDAGTDTWTGSVSFGAGLDFPITVANKAYRATNVRLPWPGTYNAGSDDSG